MKKLLILTLGLFALLSACTRENEPKVGIKLPQQELRNLELLCRTWGLVKYRHPAFKTGAPIYTDADSELLKLIPLAIDQETDIFNETLAGWIEGLGGELDSPLDLQEVIKEMEQDGYTIEYLTSYNWFLNDGTLGEKLKGLLERTSNYLSDARFRYAPPSDYGYVSINENGHGQWGDLTVEQRLLALFRYWNIIEYCFPAKYLTDTPWDKVLVKYIPEFVDADGTTGYKKVMARLITEIGDTHAAVSIADVLPLRGNYAFYLDVKFVENKLIARSDIVDGREVIIKAGDEIVSSAGRTPQQLIEQVREYCSTSNERGVLREAASLAWFSNNQTLDVVFISDGQTKSYSFPAYKQSDNPSPVTRSDEQSGSNDFPIRAAQSFLSSNGVQIPSHIYTRGYALIQAENIGYIYPRYLKSASVPAMMSEFRDTKAIIIDMRYSNSSDGALYILPYGYIHETPYDFVRFRQVYPYYPGMVQCYNYSTDMYISSNYSSYDGKVVVLVDENTQSNLEFTTMFFQPLPNCIVVGTQTAGADGNIVWLDMPGGSKTLYSGLGVQYPDGTETQRSGIKIDHEVKETIADYKAGLDPYIEKAVEILK